MPVQSAAPSAAATAIEVDNKLALAAAGPPTAASLQQSLASAGPSHQDYRRQEPRIVSLDSGDDDGDDETRLKTGDTSLSEGSTAGKLPSLPSIQSLLGLSSGASASLYVAV
jgi:hypothetical protein